MKRLDFYWKTNREWWEYVDHIPTIKDSAPEEAKASYMRYLLQTYEVPNGYSELVGAAVENARTYDWERIHVYCRKNNKNLVDMTPDEILQFINN